MRAPEARGWTPESWRRGTGVAGQETNGRQVELVAEVAQKVGGIQSSSDPHSMLDNDVRSKSFDAVASALDSIQGFSDDEREAIVELLKVGRTRMAAGHEGVTTVVTAIGSRGFNW